MTEIKILHEKATALTGRFINGIKSDQWQKQSTCTDWSVRELVNHIVYENFWVPDLLLSKTVAEVGDKYDGDLLGDDPIEVWHTSSQDAQAAVDALKKLDQPCHLSYADVPCSEYLNQRILDLIIHGWDVAKSTGQRDMLDPELVAYIYEYVAPREKELRASGLFGKKIAVATDADRQTQLLALLGRKR